MDYEFYRDLLVCANHTTPSVYLSEFPYSSSREFKDCVFFQSTERMKAGCVGKSDIYTCDMKVQVSFGSTWYY